MKSKTEIVNIYKYVDKYQGYLLSNKNRVDELNRLVKDNSKYIERSVLDIGAGGGILGVILNNRIDNYLGIDINKDIVNASKPAMDKLGLRLVQGDARYMKISGKYDTIVMVGNVLGHLTYTDFTQLMKNIQNVIKPNSNFIIDYRDTVKMLFNKEWSDIYVSNDGLSISKDINTIDGFIDIDMWNTKSGKVIGYTQTIWSPFILEGVMNRMGWKLSKRSESREWRGWLDIYSLKN